MHNYRRYHHDNAYNYISENHILFMCKTIITHIYVRDQKTTCL